MGEAFALLSMLCFALTNITIVRGHDGKSRSGGAFLSILVTFLMSAAVFVAGGMRRGWPDFNIVAVLWFGFAGFLTVFIGRVFVYASIQQLGAIKASAVKRLNPFFAVLLGVTLLGEALSAPMIVGMLLILASFGVLIRQALLTPEGASDLAAGQSAFSRIVNLGYLFGPVSAFAYASGYVARKYGLMIMPDAAFGAMIGALSGIIFFAIASGFIRSYAEDLQKTFTVYNGWLLAAALLSSIGQLSYFAALNHIGISKIALITSMEVFLTMLLSTVVFMHKEKLSGDVLIAAFLGFFGTAVIIIFT